MQIHLRHLHSAWYQVQRGSQAAGIDGITPELFSGIAPEQLQRLQLQLQREQYRARPARGFQLAKPNGGHRLIGISTVNDRIIQRYLLQGLYPRLEKVYSDVCHAYRLGYSTHTAIAQILEQYRHQPTWVVKIDIQQFFDQIVWAILLAQLEMLKIPPIALTLIEQQLRAGIQIHGRSIPKYCGVTQGNILSGALANLYLSDFDRACLDSGINLVRYGDDCLAVCQSWLEANRALNLISQNLEDLYLTVNPEKSRILAPDESFIYLGYQFQNGQAQAPIRKTRASPSNAKPQAAPRSVGRPKQCSLVKTPKQATTQTNSDNYWSDGMTTLYVTDQGAYVKVQNQQFQVFHQQEMKISVPVNRVSHIVLFGCSNLSHGAVSLSLQRRIPVLYLSSNGKYFGRLETEGHAQIDYLTQQVQKSLDPEFALRQSQSMIAAKMHNSRILLQRLNRKRPSDVAKNAIAQLAELIPEAMTAPSIETLMGYEGHAASLYFPAYATLLKGEFEFTKRTRRPPTDPVNSLLSLGYTLLSQNIHSMVETAGLHTHFGNLHKPQKTRPSLVCDLVEEFRAIVVDSFVAYLVNSHILTAEDFTPPDDRGGVYLFPDALKVFLKHWKEKLNQQVVHPHTGYKVSYWRCFELQVWEYVSVLQDERSTYRPMQWEK
jgi:CRISP-associated protein Cas1